MPMSRHEAFVREMSEKLHDLCQPLTALQCRLEMAKMQGDPTHLLETVDDSLIETARMFAAIAEMRLRLFNESTQQENQGEEEV